MDRCWFHSVCIIFIESEMITAIISKLILISRRKKKESLSLRWYGCIVLILHNLPLNCLKTIFSLIGVEQ